MNRRPGAGLTPFTVGKVMWGLLIMWIGVMMVVEEKAGVASIGAGVILLGGAVARRAFGWRGGVLVTICGLLLIAFGINDLNGADRGIPLIAVGLIAFGSMIIGKALGRGRAGRDGTITINVNRNRR